MSMYGNHTRRPVVVCGPGRTKQAMKDECDVNLIVARYVRDGLVTHLAKGQPRYLDVSEVGDYRSAIEQVRAVEDFFDALPAKVRAYFQNDPAAFLDTMSDPAKAVQLDKLGQELYGDRRASRNRREGDEVPDVVEPPPEAGGGS